MGFAIRLAPEHVEDARSGRIRLRSEALLNPALKFLLREELLKCASCRNHAVGKRHCMARFDVPIEASRYNKRSRRQLPCFAQGFAPLKWVLDDVYNVTEVHDVGGRLLGAGCMDRVPAR